MGQLFRQQRRQPETAEQGAHGRSRTRPGQERGFVFGQHVPMVVRRSLLVKSGIVTAMAGRLAGKVAIVTGAGSQAEGVGNGKAAAVLFAREGAKVLCVDQVVERAEQTVAAIMDEGGMASAFECDVSRQAGCREMGAAAMERYGRLDILQNNVGISSRQS